MGARDLAFVGCRLLAFYSAFLALSQLPQILALSGSDIWAADDSSDRSSDMLVVWLVGSATHVALAVLLWIAAPSLAGAAARGTVPGEKASYPARELLLFGIGVFLLVHAIPRALSSVYRVAVAEASLAWAGGELIASLVELVIALGLLLGRGFFLRALRRLQGVGWARDDASDTDS